MLENMVDNKIIRWNLDFSDFQFIETNDNSKQKSLPFLNFSVPSIILKLRYFSSSTFVFLVLDVQKFRPVLSTDLEQRKGKRRQ